MRCIYESLALKYRFALGQLEAATGRRFAALHVLGGGAKDGLLCRMTADATGLRTAAGPVEATALGNILIQLVALGMLPSIDEMCIRDRPIYISPVYARSKFFSGGSNSAHAYPDRGNGL